MPKKDYSAMKTLYGLDHFYFILPGELYKNMDNNKAKLNFEKAYALAKTQTEKQSIQSKIDGLT